MRFLMDDYKAMGDYQYSDKNSSVTAITFLLVGLGIGAITALLLAPKPGKHLRKAVRRKLEDARDSVDDFSVRAGDYWDRGSEWANNQKERVRPLVRKMQRY
jgi:gas vesicle protein